MRCVNVLTLVCAAVVWASGSAAAESYLFVADYDKHSVLRFDAATGDFVDVFVSNHSGGLHEPYFLLLGPHDHNLYVGSGHFNPSDHRKGVLRYDKTTGAFLDQFTTSGHVDSTHGMIFGPDGNLYVGDWVGGFNFQHGQLGGAVRRFDGATGVFIDDFVPTGSGGLTHPWGMVFGPSVEDPGRLDLYVGDGSGAVMRYHGTTGASLGTYVPAGSGGLAFVNGVVFGPDGNLYVADSGFFSGGSGAGGSGYSTSAVYRYQGPTGASPGAFIDVFIPPGRGGLVVAGGIIFGPDGNSDGHQDLYVTSAEPTGIADQFKDGTVKRYDGITGAFLGDFLSARSGGLSDPFGMTFTETDPVTLNYLGGPPQQALTHSVPEPATAALLLSMVGSFIMPRCRTVVGRST